MFGNASGVARWPAYPSSLPMRLGVLVYASMRLGWVAGLTTSSYPASHYRASATKAARAPQPGSLPVQFACGRQTDCDSQLFSRSQARRPHVLVGGLDRRSNRRHWLRQTARRSLARDKDQKCAFLRWRAVPSASRTGVRGPVGPLTRALQPQIAAGLNQRGGVMTSHCGGGGQDDLDDPDGLGRARRGGSEMERRTFTLFSQ